MKLLSFFNPKKNFQSLWKRPETGRVDSLDGLRALSVTWITILHVVFLAGFILPPDQYRALYERPEIYWIYKGSLGVDIFFTLSGFLIGSILFKELQTNNGLNFKQFYLRRSFRILPIYFFMLAFEALGGSENVENIVYNIIYLNNYLPSGEQFMAVTWSLAIEEQFYTICPLLLWVLFRFPQKTLPVLVLLLIAAFAIRYQVIYTENAHPIQDYDHVQYNDNGAHYSDAAAQYDNVAYMPTHMRYGGLLIGVILAYLVVCGRIVQTMQHRVGLRRLMLIISLGGIGGYLFFTPYTSEVQVSHGFALMMAGYRYVFNFLIAGIILYCLTPAGQSSWVSKFLSSKFWFPFAQLSYAAYLCHLFVVGISMNYLENGIPGRIGMIVFMLLVTAGTFLFSLILFLLVEKPFMNMRRFFSS